MGTLVVHLKSTPYQKPAILTPPPVVTLKKKKSIGSPMNPFSVKPQPPKVSAVLAGLTQKTDVQQECDVWAQRAISYDLYACLPLDSIGVLILTLCYTTD